MNSEDKIKPSVSIIIPVYNVEEYIDECLASVESQNYNGSIECIIVDDCGTDKSMEKVINFLHKYKGPICFKIISHEKNRGLSAARNTGILNANGEYVYFLDSDDEITPDCLKILTDPLSKIKYDVVIGEYLEVGSNKKYIHLDKINNELLRNEEIINCYTNNYLYTMAWNKLCNKKFLEDNTIFFKEGIVHEDELWNFILCMQAKCIFISKEICYIYKIRTNSITTSTDKTVISKRLDSKLFVCTELSRIINENKLYSNKHIMEYLQRKWFGLIGETLFLTPSKYNSIYACWHSIYHRSPYFNTRKNSFSIKSYVRDLHLKFPEKIGSLITRMLILILSIKSHVRIPRHSLS